MSAGAGHTDFYAGRIQYRQVCVVYTPMFKPNFDCEMWQEIAETAYEMKFLVKNRYIKSVLEVIPLAHSDKHPMVSVKKVMGRKEALYFLNKNKKIRGSLKKLKEVLYEHQRRKF